MNPEQPASLSSTPNNQTAPISSGHKSKKPLAILLVLLLVCGALAGGYFYGKGQNNNTPSQATKTPVNFR
jgi:uncharacterized protein HemX